VLISISALYDFALIDGPPSLGLLTINILTAAKKLLIPIQCEYYALEGISQLLTVVNGVQSSINCDLAIGLVILTMQDGRTNLSQQVIDEVRSYFGESVAQTTIPRNVRLSEAPSFGKPICLYDSKSKGSVAYHDLALEVLQRMALPSPPHRRNEPSGADWQHSFQAHHAQTRLINYQYYLLTKLLTTAIFAAFHSLASPLIHFSRAISFIPRS
jgi:MinD-like ATPase involved in chromosome partitioning or flagellar assembly